jgi:hypothetical protein
MTTFAWAVVPATTLNIVDPRHLVFTSVEYADRSS